MEVRHGGVARQAVEGDRPGDDPGVGIVGDVGCAVTRGLDRRYLLRTGERHGERDRRRLRQGHRPAHARPMKAMTARREMETSILIISCRYDPAETGPLGLTS